MNWPWSTAAREREKNLIFQISALQQALNRECGEVQYWRQRYERLADLALVRQVNPNAVAAVHVEPKTNDVANLGARIGKIAGVMGAGRGIPFETLHHAQAADSIER